jgi:hypothetical protein
VNGPNVVVVRDPYGPAIGVMLPNDGAEPARRGYSSLVISLLGLSVALCFYDLYVLFAFASG